MFSQGMGGPVGRLRSHQYQGRPPSGVQGAGRGGGPSHGPSAAGGTRTWLERRLPRVLLLNFHAWGLLQARRGPRALQLGPRSCLAAGGGWELAQSVNQVDEGLGGLRSGLCSAGQSISAC